jgi:mRNA interferase RelE/StbE
VNWSVRWTERSLKDLRRLDSTSRSRVLQAIARLVDADLGDVKKLRGLPGYRLRVGDLRVFFERDSGLKVLAVTAIRNRGDAY